MQKVQNVTYLIATTMDFVLLIPKKVEEAGLRVSVSSKKAALCKEHYKEWKKETKEDRSLDRARFDIY